MISGPDSSDYSRKPEIMADAVYALICKDSKSISGEFLIDEEILKNEGITDFTDYACNPGKLNIYKYFNASFNFCTNYNFLFFSKQRQFDAWLILRW